MRGSEGDEAALNELVPLVERELHWIARAYMRRERQRHTLQATALVNEVFLRLGGRSSPRWRDRAHFVGIAARLMRQVLVDHARSWGYQKRGGGVQRVPLDNARLITPEPALDVLAVDRWRDIDAILRAALAREPHERPAFVADACAGDSEVRLEVESLLAHGTTTDHFLSTPAAALIAAAEPPASFIGRRCGFPDQGNAPANCGRQTWRLVGIVRFCQVDR